MTPPAPESPRRILLVSRSIPAHRAGGMEFHVQDIAEGLMAAGWEVHVLTTPLPAEPVFPPPRLNGGLHSLGTLGTKTDGRYSLYFMQSLAAHALAICVKHKIELVHAQGFTGIPLSDPDYAPHLPPVVTTIHGTLWTETPLDRVVRRRRSLAQRGADLWRFKHRFAFWPAWRGFLRKTPMLLTDSDFTVRELRRENPALNPIAVPLGFDLGRFPELAARPQFVPEQRALATGGALEGTAPFLFAYGRLEPLKGFRVLAEAFLSAIRETPALPHHLVIGGDGPERAPLERLAADAGMANRIHLLGKVGGADLGRWLAAADAAANPDLGRPAFGLTLAEALVCGCPVLASDTGAHGEVIASAEDGTLIPPGDTAAWTRAIQEALAREEPAPARQARAARARARFSREAFVERLVGSYDKCALNGQPGARV
ncbi:MAG: glycosyltransferase family 4 protein [Sumerlaeia bacterium]